MKRENTKLAPPPLHLPPSPHPSQDQYEIKKKKKKLTHHQMHKIKASNGRSEEALRERGGGDRKTASQQRQVQQGRRANDSECNEGGDLTTA